MLKRFTKRALSGIISVIMLLMMTVPAFAAESSIPLKIEFSDFYFETTDYSPSKVFVEYKTTATEETALIRDKNTGTILETMSVEKPQTRSVGPYTFKRSSSYGATKVELVVHVELYSEGSFRQINSLQGKTLRIATSITNTEFENEVASVWSTTGSFPTDSLYYSYSGTLLATVSSSSSTEISAELMGAGFSYSESTEGNTHYRRSFDSSGTISVY